jgi:hypothetical protein
MTLQPFKQRKKQPQGYYYKDGQRWVKFFIEHQDELKWNLYCRQLGGTAEKKDWELFIDQTGIQLLNL